MRIKIPKLTRQRTCWHESGHVLMGEHFGYRVLFSTARQFLAYSGLTIAAPPDAGQTAMGDLMRRLGGAAAEAVVYGEGPGGFASPLAGTDFARIEGEGVPRAVWREAKDILIAKRPRLNEIANALMEHKAINGGLQPASAQEIEWAKRASQIDIQKNTGVVFQSELIFGKNRMAA